MSLHTRSLKYGKLHGGVLVVVAACLMKRLKQHFHHFKFGVDVIFGMNGFVWVSPAPEGEGLQSEEGQGTLNDVAIGAQAVNGNQTEPPTREEREKVCRVRNALIVLDSAAMSVSPMTVAAVYMASLNIPAREMLLPHRLAELVAPVMT